METFGERLAEIRKSKNMYQYELAEKLGIHKVTYSNYEQNKREMDFALLKRVCKLLDVSADYLIGLSHSPQGLDQFTDEEMKYMLKSLSVYKEIKREFD
ncbi:helix-turn-helix transcriptional regulator [Bacillus sp. JCM 19041]|uniref:helix-turn-helix domain-containing protein n=1 Tax=Bacillus sp. JCM 19041 TaxID=1460637 RepID=UPI0006D05F3B